MKLPFEIFVSLRYLRSKKRYGTVSLNTFISIAGVVIGVATSIITLSVMTGFQGYFRDKILSAISHVVVMDFSGKGVKDSAELEAKVEGVPHVVATTPFIISQVMLSSNERVQGVVVRGIDPAREGKVTDLAKNIKQGSIADLEGREGKRLPGIIIGEDLARKFGSTLGDTITMVNPIGEESAMGMIPKMKKFQLVGIFDAGMYDYNTTFVYISIPEAQKFFTMPGRISGIQVRVDDIYQAAQIADAIQAHVGYPYYTRNWIEMNKNFFSALKLEKIGMSLILAVIIIVASFNIIGTLTMIVMEKSREIAILKSMGATERSIMKVFIFSGLTIGIVGTVIGAVIGYGAVTVIAKSGIITLPRDVYQVSYLPLTITGTDILFISLMAVGISFLATIYPAWQAGRQDP
ncbi:MAG: lipoprotein-releasing ABC transporter permease subunit, partial [Nitrospiraceae bacterium]|nr:lipoprotein-releasing ABC transporter permease subunit [Nitrospiraceae bacterium]